MRIETRLTALERSKQLSTVRRIFVRWPETDRGPGRVTVNVGLCASTCFRLVILASVERNSLFPRILNNCARKRVL